MAKTKWVLQLCHGYGAPFGDVARQWAVLFEGSEYRVLTVFLTGSANQKVAELVGGEVVFLDYQSKDIRGLKRRQVKDVRTLHEKYQFSFAVAHRYKPIYIATHVKGLKVVGVAHAYSVFDKFFRRRYVGNCRDRLTLVGVSDAIRDDLRNALPNYPDHKIQTLYNRINAQKYLSGHLDRTEARSRLGLPSDAYIVGNVGRLHPDKDQKTLVAGFARALHALSGDALLAIVGEGRLGEDLKEQAQALGIEKSVVFLGRVEEAWRFFKAFDLFVLSSNYEPFGMVLLEAMVAGVPVISTNVGGAPEVLGNTGWLFSLGDTEGLASLLIASKSGPPPEGGLQRVMCHFSDDAARASFRDIMSQIL